MAYTKKTWVDVPDPSNLPSIPEGQDSLARFDAENMNRMEDGVDEAQEHLKNASLHNRSTEGGGALGGNTSVTTGGAVGHGASSTNGGAVGHGASSTNGGAVGKEALTTTGGAVGSGASSALGGAVGYETKTGNGFAGGKEAKTVDTDGNAIDAVQLGTGVNPNSKTLQIYNHTLMKADGTIPAERMPSKAPDGHGLGTISTTYRENFIDAIKRGGGSYTLGDAQDSPTEYNSWLSLLQLVRDVGEGTETGSQLAFRDYNKSNPQMWFRAIINGAAGNWYEILHTGNMPRIQIVSYVGTGEFGVDNPCSLTFSFVPKMILWVAYESDSGEGGLRKSDSAYSIMLCDKLTTEYVKGVGIADDNWNHNYAKKSADGKTVSWYVLYTGTTADASTLQLNNEHNTYYFIGIG